MKMEKILFCNITSFIPGFYEFAMTDYEILHGKELTIKELGFV